MSVSDAMGNVIKHGRHDSYSGGEPPMNALDVLVEVLLLGEVDRGRVRDGGLGEGGDDVLAQQLNGLEVLLVAHAIDPEDELVVAQLLKLPAPLDEEVGIAD